MISRPSHDTIPSLGGLGSPLFPLLELWPTLVLSFDDGAVMIPALGEWTCHHLISRSFHYCIIRRAQRVDFYHDLSLASMKFGYNSYERESSCIEYEKKFLRRQAVTLI